MEQHFIASGDTDDKVKRASFLTETFELLQKLSNNDLTGKTFAEIKKLLDDHFTEKQHVLAARFKFYSIRMKPNQTSLSFSVLNLISAGLF